MKTHRFHLVSLVLACTLGACAEPPPEDAPAKVVGPEPTASSTSAVVTPGRPNMTMRRVELNHHTLGGAHNLTRDGRLYISLVDREVSPNLWHRHWRAQAFRPKGLAYASDGMPIFDAAFSEGAYRDVQASGENGLAFCYSDSDVRPEGADRVYSVWIFDSRAWDVGIGNPGADRSVLRRRHATIRVANWDSADAEVTQFDMDPVVNPTTPDWTFDDMRLKSDRHDIYGFEPTMSTDGRLLIFQSGPGERGGADLLYYSYNDNPCARDGWTQPRPLDEMYEGLRADVRDRYPFARQPLRAADGQVFGGAAPHIKGAYPWLDPESRNLFYMASQTNILPDGQLDFTGPNNTALFSRRQSPTLIGIDTRHTAYVIDGPLNDPYRAGLFHTSPMWRFEKEAAGWVNASKYLPITKGHDIVPFFTSSSQYGEVDLSEIKHPADWLTFDMTPMVDARGCKQSREECGYGTSGTRNTYCCWSTVLMGPEQVPDLSGAFHTGTLIGGAELIYPDPSWNSHGRGHVLSLPSGHGALRASVGGNWRGQKAELPDDLRSFSIQMAVRPLQASHQDCWQGWSYLAFAPGSFDLIHEANGELTMSLWINGQYVRLGRSPALPTNEWSHVAYTWDGHTGEMREYINGKPTTRQLPRVPGRLGAPTGDVFIGGNENSPVPSACQGGAGFIGFIDEVRLFAQARTARSTCLSAVGSDCGKEAIVEAPSAGQYLVTEQQPTCRDASQPESAACRSAAHRVCAQVGVRSVLDSASLANLPALIEALLSGAPPISLAGVMTSANSHSVQISCLPAAIETFPLDFAELTAKHGGCRGEDDLAGTACDIAAHLRCKDRGKTSGYVFEATARPWLACFDAAEQRVVAQADLGFPCRDLDLGDPRCRMAASQWCQRRGHGGGVMQDLWDNHTALVACFEGSTVRVPWTCPPGDPSCTENAHGHTWYEQLSIVDWTGKYLTGDFDGDGRMDIVRGYANGSGLNMDVLRSTGSTFHWEHWATGQGGYWPAQKWLVGDFNGDHKDDVAIVWNDGGQATIDVEISTGSQFYIDRFSTQEWGFWDEQKWVAGDFNGDGRTDLANIFDDHGGASIDVHLSTSGSFFPQHWATQQLGFWPAEKWLAGDFNGDGKTDLANVYEDSGQADINVHLSINNKFVVQSPQWATHQLPIWPEQQWFAADIDGDGRTDLGKVWNDGGRTSVDVHYARAASFEWSRWMTRADYYYANGVYLVGDYDGDSVPDVAGVLVVNESGVSSLHASVIDHE